MTEINEFNLENFNELYHNFHDATITQINYDILASQIDLSIKTMWVGSTKLKSDNTYEVKSKLVQLKFFDIESLSIKELYSFDYIKNATIAYVNINNKKYIKFEDKENELYIIAENIKYKEVNNG